MKEVNGAIIPNPAEPWQIDDVGYPNHVVWYELAHVLVKNDSRVNEGKRRR